MTQATNVLVVGDGPVATALVPMLETLGWSPVVATTMEEVWTGLAGVDAVVVLSHHDEVDAPAIKAALTSGTSYVGAMGSRKTQARRREWLTEHGVTEADLAALRAPIGLDIGADEPGEIAVSILAEIVAVRRGAAGAGAISGREGPIHPDLDPGTAFCPGG
ncbi:XdhC family protein [Nocardioides sp. LS1]|uniref:XdhC family protein n=1 Tax=Nocardioides sp. LS1 TaxID=1027620 RepID=UPI00163A68B6|nr:XdhC family protein [Nocardioides sp. LS1]